MSENKREAPQTIQIGKSVPLSRRLGIIYLEKAMVVSKGQTLAYLNTESKDTGCYFSIPVAAVGGILLGPGTSITNKAIRTAAEHQCIVYFGDSGGVPLRAASAPDRNPQGKIKQYQICLDAEKRLSAAKLLLEARNQFSSTAKSNNILPIKCFENAFTINELMGIEAAWAKAFYRRLASENRTPWNGKKQLGDKNSLIFLNHLAYQLADIAIFHLGLERDIGVLHGRTKGGALTYDLADTIKPVLCTVPALANLNGQDVGRLKNSFIKDVIKTDAISFMTDTLSTIFKGEKP